jgi:hypothetical protein
MKTFSITEDQMAILLETFITAGEAIANKSGINPALVDQFEKSYAICEKVVNQ